LGTASPRMDATTDCKSFGSHGIRNEILEEFAKKKEMCHLKQGVRQSTEPAHQK
jgi:hypothetical protein